MNYFKKFFVNFTISRHLSENSLLSNVFYFGLLIFMQTFNTMKDNFFYNYNKPLTWDIITSVHRVWECPFFPVSCPNPSAKWWTVVTCPLPRMPEALRDEACEESLSRKAHLWFVPAFSSIKTTLSSWDFKVGGTIF